METASIDMHDVHSRQGSDGVRPWNFTTHLTVSQPLPNRTSGTSLVFHVQPIQPIQPPAAPTSETVDATETSRRKSWGWFIPLGSPFLMELAPKVRGCTERLHQPVLSLAQADLTQAFVICNHQGYSIQEWCWKPVIERIRRCLDQSSGPLLLPNCKFAWAGNCDSCSRQKRPRRPISYGLKLQACHVMSPICDVLWTRQLLSPSNYG